MIDKQKDFDALIAKVFKTRDENEIVKTILQAGQKKFATLHNYFQSELDFIK